MLNSMSRNISTPSSDHSRREISEHIYAPAPVIYTRNRPFSCHICYIKTHARLLNVSRIPCNRLIQHLIQQLHNQQKAIICHFTMCLLHVSASTWPSSGRYPTKEYSVICHGISTYWEHKDTPIRVKMTFIQMFVCNDIHMKCRTFI